MRSILGEPEFDAAGIFCHPGDLYSIVCSLLFLPLTCLYAALQSCPASESSSDCRSSSRDTPLTLPLGDVGAATSTQLPKGSSEEPFGGQVSLSNALKLANASNVGETDTLSIPPQATFGCPPVQNGLIESLEGFNYSIPPCSIPPISV